MRTRTSASLNGEEFSNIDGRIILQSIEEPAPNWNIVMASDGMKYGQRVTTKEKRFRDVIIRFAIREHQDMIGREHVIQKVRDWAAGGGWLEISYRPFERLSVMCFTMPAVNGITKSADNYTITFRSIGAPEWEAKEPATATASGASGTADIFILPSEGGPLRVQAKNNSGSTCNTIQIAGNGKTMRFENLGMASGETFQIEYDRKNMQSIQIISGAGVARSALANRTTGSADDILMAAGNGKITYSAERAMDWKFYVHGRWAG